jgi:hypothetical protein
MERVQGTSACKLKLPEQICLSQITCVFAACSPVAELV